MGEGGGACQGRQGSRSGGDFEASSEATGEEEVEVWQRVVRFAFFIVLFAFPPGSLSWLSAFVMSDPQPIVPRR